MDPRASQQEKDIAAASLMPQEKVFKLVKAGGVIKFVDNGKHTAKKVKSSGRAGKQRKLKEIANDNKVSSALRGEIRRDINKIKLGKRKNIRVPQGYHLAHRRGYEAWRGL